MSIGTSKMNLRNVFAYQKVTDFRIFHSLRIIPVLNYSFVDLPFPYWSCILPVEILR